jgi:hypothetical protein
MQNSCLILQGFFFYFDEEALPLKCAPESGLAETNLGRELDKPDEHLPVRPF